MEDLSAEWIHEMEIEDSDLINQCQLTTMEVFDFHSLSPEAYQLSPEASDSPAYAFGTGNPGNRKVDSWVNASAFPSTRSNLKNVTIPETPQMGDDDYTGFLNMSANSSRENLSSDGAEGGEEEIIIESKSLSRPPLQARNHIIAERKRRERLNEKLISLAALIPGLKKMDKASILGDATRYIKQLEERVQKLEMGEPSVITSKRARSTSNDERSVSSHKSSDGHNIDPYDRPFPEVDMRVSDKHLLLRIHCKKQESLLAKILQALGKFSINVVSTSIQPFGDSALDITVIGEVRVEKRAKMENLLKTLRSTILKLL